MADYSKIKPIASKVGTSYYLKPCDDNGKSSLDYEYGDKVDYKNLAHIFVRQWLIIQRSSQLQAK